MTRSAMVPIRVPLRPLPPPVPLGKYPLDLPTVGSLKLLYWIA